MIHGIEHHCVSDMMIKIDVSCIRITMMMKVIFILTRRWLEHHYDLLCMVVTNLVFHGYFTS